MILFFRLPPSLYEYVQYVSPRMYQIFFIVQNLPEGLRVISLFVEI